MKKTLILSILTLACGITASAHAAPALQTCSPMEVTHNGNAGLSYNLRCEAGGWQLNYVGSVPAGTSAVTAQYRLAAQHGDGRTFTNNRSVRLPSPAMLGQALVREAVELDNGEIALRDCPDYSCTLYRPLTKGKSTAATVTVPPEVKRLQDERLQLNADLAARSKELADQSSLAIALKAEVESLKATLEMTQGALTRANQDLSKTESAAAEKEAAQAAAAQSTLREALSNAVTQSDAAWAAKVTELTATVEDLSVRLKSQDGAYKEAISVLEDSNTKLYESLTTSKAEVEQLKKAPSAEVFNFVVSDLQAQHTAQVAAVKGALPDTNFEGVLRDLVIPTVAVAVEVAPSAEPTVKHKKAGKSAKTSENVSVGKH